MSPLSHSRAVAARMGRWSASHWKTATVAWLVFVVVAVVVGGKVGTRQLSDADSQSGESARAQRILDRAGFDTPQKELVLVQGTRLGPRTHVFRGAVRDVVAAVEATGAATNVRSPYENPGQISKDGRSAIVELDLAPDGDVGNLLSVVSSVRRQHPGLRIEEFGEASADRALNDTLDRDFHRAEYLSVPLTIGILLIAFGALVAALLPVLLALTAFAAALGLAAFASRIVGLDDAANSVMLLIGLAVGVDYCLFYLKREREERAAGRDSQAALEAAAATSGRSVLISGLTVIVAMAGMFLAGSKVFVGIGLATILVVAIAVVGSLTVLPALLSRLGDKVERGRIPLVHRKPRSDQPGIWGSVVARALRRPLLSALLAGGALVALALPALGLHTSIPGANDLPQSLPIIKTYNRVQTAFPGRPAPAEVVVHADNVDSPRVRAALAELKKAALASGEAENPISVDVNPNRTVAVVSVPLVGDGAGDPVSEHALATLRTSVIPDTLGASGIEAAVAGEVAASKDFNAALSSHAPLVVGFVLALAFLLLLIAFRSIVIAGTAVLLNLLSVAAAYGFLVLVFQRGWGESLLGFHSTGAIISWLPIFMFVVLFGLSMDYHVFILSRIREGHDRGLSTDEAITYGVRSTAGVVTAAAVVMVFVFGIFGTLSQVSMKQLGVGLAVAVLIDATIIRGVLLPATMKLLGPWNWYLPQWLGWLPRLQHERAVVQAPVEP